MAQVQTRMTRQRAVILEELRKTKSHPTADELYSIVRERLPRISLGTVYRNLDFLADSGEIRRLEAAGSTKRFDGDISWHQHVRCLRCGRIGDVMQPLGHALGGTASRWRAFFPSWARALSLTVSATSARAVRTMCNS